MGLITTALKIFTIILSICVATEKAWSNGSCPPIGQSPSCGVLITIQPTGALKIEVDPSVPPFDGTEDTLVGVVNKSGATVFGISLTGNDIFGFDGDGAGVGGDYAGPGTSFTLGSDTNSGIVNFTSGLAPNGFLWFSLEGVPSNIKLAQNITLDPGHGTTCPIADSGDGRGSQGTVGSKIYPVSNPPAGPLKEDELTVDVSLKLQTLLANAGYKVTLTKNTVAACPTLLTRGALAEKVRSNLLVSVHFDAPEVFGGNPFQSSGSMGLYNSAKLSAKTLAEDVAKFTAAAVGVNNRGPVVENGKAILKTTVTRVTSIVIEVGRLSSPDDDLIHTSSGTQNAANGIKAGIDAFLNQ